MRTVNKSLNKQNPNCGWHVTTAGTGALLAMGVLYAWSVFKSNIPDEWGWTDSQKSLPYSVAIIVIPIMTMVGAKLLGNFNHRVMITMGGIFAGLGVVLSSLSTSPWMFTFTFGLLLGTGIGFVYSSAIPAALKWFPASKTGLISGIVVAGFGMGSAWVAPLARIMIRSIGIQPTMLYMGIGMIVVVVVFAQFVKLPPAGFVQQEDSSPLHINKSITTDFTTVETLRTWQFYIIWITFALASGASLMIIGNLAPIVNDQVGLPGLSAIAVSALAIGNGGGRVLYGMLSDKLGRIAMLRVAFVIQALLVLLMSIIVKGSPLANIPTIVVIVIFIGVNFGANLSVFPAITKDYFGSKNFAMNYGLVFTAWGIGGFLLSQLASAIKDTTGSFTPAYFLSSAMLIVASLAIGLLKTPQPDDIILRLKNVEISGDM